MKKNVINITAVIMIMLLCSSCISWIDFDGEVKLPELENEDKLPNMSFVPLFLYDNIPNEYIDLSETFKEFGKSIKKSLMHTSGSETGYYGFKWLEDHENSLWGVLGGGFIHGLLVGIPTILGVPTDIETYTIEIILSIFDSNGNLIKEISGKGKIIRSAGLYYGYKCKKDQAVKIAFKNIQKKLSKSLYDINDSLKKAGPNIPDNDNEIKEKIREKFSDSVLCQFYNQNYDRFERQLGKNYSKKNSDSNNYVPSAPSVDDNNTSPQIQTPFANLLKSPIKSGRYNSVGIPNCYVYISTLGTSGTLTMNIDGNQVMGTYNIEDNQIVVRYASASGSLSSYSNTTVIYEILSETRFRTGGAVFVYAGY